MVIRAKVDPKRSGNYKGKERRRHPRICEPFPVKVRGQDANGKRYRFDTTLENMSAGGLFFHSAKIIKEEEILHLTIHFRAGQSAATQTARVAARGLVVRTEAAPDNQTGIATRLISHRFR